MKRSIASTAGCLLVLAAAGTATAPAASASGKVKVKVVARGLNSPKHLLYTARGVYVVESGEGGSSCVTGPGLEPGKTAQYCAGPSAAVALIKGSHVTTVLGGLASVTEGEEAAGPSAVTVSAQGELSVLYQDVLVEADGKNGLAEPAKAVAGTFRISPSLSVNIAAYEAAHPQDAATFGGTPGETTYDSDPYDVVPYKGGYVVADAAANSILEVSSTGVISRLAYFPTLPETVPAGVFGPKPVPVDAQSVPTSLAVRGNAIYVGLLRGVPSQPGTAYIYRVVPGQQPQIWAKGLSAVTAIAFDSKGRLLATEYSTGGLLAAPKVPGALVRVSANGKKVTKLPVAGLVEPAGVAVSPKGDIWVANYGTSSAKGKPSGEVLEITGVS